MSGEIQIQRGDYAECEEYTYDIESFADSGPDAESTVETVSITGCVPSVESAAREATESEGHSRDRHRAIGRRDRANGGDATRPKRTGSKTDCGQFERSA